MNLEQKKIVRDITDTLSVGFKEVMGKVRQQRIVNARWFSWYALRLRDYTCQEIADVWDVHHTAVSFACREIRQRINTNDRPTLRIITQLYPVLETQQHKYRYHVTVNGEVIVTSSKELNPSAIRERALAEVDRGMCQFTTETTHRKEIAEAA